MNTFSLTRRSFIGALLALACFVPASLASGPAPERDQRKFEINFLTMMIDHHYGAVKMAELCAGRTVHADLQAMCDQIKTSQTAEIVTMQSWLQSWYGLNHDPMLDRKTARQVQYLSTLNGAAFEKAFMAIMIRHHSMAVTMALDALNQAYHPELLNMAAMMLGAQGDEIAQMRIWLQQWYGILDPDRNDHP